MKKGKRILALTMAFCITASAIFASKTSAATDYSKYSNKKISWNVNLAKNHIFREGKISTKTLRKLNTFVTATPKAGDKVIYLTFTCGYEAGYTGKLLDILKKNNIKTTFFVTGEYIRDRNNKIRRMKKEGHLVGNHTASHSFKSSYSTTFMKNDLKKCKALMKERTGYTMDPYFRPPSGDFSLRSLKVAQDLGYTSFLWSYSYYDYMQYDQPSYLTVIKGFQNCHYNGMIALLHTNSSANVKALPELIKYFKKKGYRFGSLKELRRETFKK